MYPSLADAVLHDARRNPRKPSNLKPWSPCPCRQPDPNDRHGPSPSTLRCRRVCSYAPAGIAGSRGPTCVRVGRGSCGGGQYQRGSRRPPKSTQALLYGGKTFIDNPKPDAARIALPRKAAHPTFFDKYLEIAKARSRRDPGG